jgi:hypothetical protein
MRAGGIFLVILGLAQMTGDVLGISALEGIAAATTASPAPKVFSAVKGLETYSTRFSIQWRDASGSEKSLELTPEVYGSIRGPYNRRNAYGAILAYGPIFASTPETRPLFESVARYALCGDAPLLVELGIDVKAAASPVRIQLEPLPSSDVGDLPLIFEAPCL